MPLALRCRVIRLKRHLWRAWQFPGGTSRHLGHVAERKSLKISPSDIYDACIFGFMGFFSRSGFLLKSRHFSRYMSYNGGVSVTVYFSCDVQVLRKKGEGKAARLSLSSPGSKNPAFRMEMCTRIYVENSGCLRRSTKKCRSTIFTAEHLAARFNTESSCLFVSLLKRLSASCFSPFFPGDSGPEHRCAGLRCRFVFAAAPLPPVCVCQQSRKLI